jgi:hypothetical protein
MMPLVSTSLAQAVQMMPLATMMLMRSLTTAHVSKQTNVAFAAETASLTVRATATATLSMLVVFAVVTARLARASALQSALAQALQAVLLRRGHLC